VGAILEHEEVCGGSQIAIDRVHRPRNGIQVDWSQSPVFVTPIAASIPTGSRQ
jgi:hypothetical protein